MKLRSIPWAFALSACAAMLWVPNNFNGQVRAAEPGTARGGASDLIRLKPIQSPADAAAIAPGDLIVMSCPKCKTISATYARTAVKRGEPTTAVGVEHLCPGCSSILVMKGHGKAKTAQFVHRCDTCGSKDVMCCVMKAGTHSTPGMKDK